MSGIPRFQTHHRQLGSPPPDWQRLRVQPIFRHIQEGIVCYIRTISQAGTKNDNDNDYDFFMAIDIVTTGFLLTHANPC